MRSTSLSDSDHGQHDTQHFDEKGIPQLSATSSQNDHPVSAAERGVASTLPVPFKLRQINSRIENLAGFEARGISRVLPQERQAPSAASDVQLAIMWYSANISLNNLAIAMLGPLAYQLGFLDSIMCAVLGAFVGSLTTAYMSIWGPQSGNRTMASNLSSPYTTPYTTPLTIPPADIVTGCFTLLHGLLAVQNPVPAQHYSHDWLCHNRLHHWWSGPVRRERWQNVHCGGNRPRQHRVLGGCCFRHGGFP